MLLPKHQSRQFRRSIEKKIPKIIRIQEADERKAYNKIINLLKDILSEEILEQIAKKVGFQKRKRTLTPSAIISVLLLGCSNSSEEFPVSALDSMCLYLKKWFNIQISKQALQKKINTKEACLFSKEVMTIVMKHELNNVISNAFKKNKKKERLFFRILIQDSTIISLPETLSRIFRGCGGSASKAAVKCDYIIDQSNHLVLYMKCVSGRVPDSALSGDIFNLVKENDLIIRDLGYFNLANFSKIIAKKAYFISRMSKGVLTYLNKDDENPLNLIEHLEKLGVKNKGIDINLYIGKKERLLVRLIGIKVPPEVVERRKQQHKQARRREEPSESLIEWRGYTLMITNYPKERLSLKAILNLYKIRWQIELFFKNMKSLLIVDEITGTNKYRILSLLYTKLALTWIAGLLYAYAQTIAKNGKEISRFKFIKWLKDHGDLKRAFLTKDCYFLIKNLESDLDVLYKEIKKKNVSYEFEYAKVA